MAEGGPEPYGTGMTASTLGALPKVGAAATRAFNSAGYTTLKGLPGVCRAELSKLHGVGPKALHVIEEALQEHGRVLTWSPLRHRMPGCGACCPTARAGRDASVSSGPESFPRPVKRVSVISCDKWRCFCTAPCRPRTTPRGA